ncbi:MAG: DNA-binding transcriptional LysR family regulator [Rhodococcus sp. (in: high G+C Gram-positive bacteria)]|jgi:DNA-binding transcriptional LysR family regulator
MRELQRVDLNLLVAFDALMTERSVTRAAERVLVGQSAMSASLARLRRLFDDPLLVRDGRAMVPTPVAESLTAPVRQSLALMESVLGRRRRFDPAVDEQAFSILASDYVMVVLLRPLLAEIHSKAPNVRIHVRPSPPDYADLLRRGLVDLVIVPRELEHSGVQLNREDLFVDRLVCAVDADNTEVGDILTREQFETLPYLGYESDVLPSVAQQQIRAHGVNRPVDVTTQSFVAAPLLLRGTPFFTVVYERLAQGLASQAGIRLLESPLAFAPITEAMHWSPRHDDSPAHRWLRARVSESAASIA